MRYVFLALGFFWLYLTAHFYYSFFQGFSLQLRLIFTAIIAFVIFVIAAMHPMEFITGVKFSGTVMAVMDFLLAMLATLFFVYLFTDILKVLHIYPTTWKKSGAFEGLVFMGIAFGICAIGLINAHIPFVMEYKIESDKDYRKDNLIVAAISDLHIGSMSMSPQKLQKAVEKINKMQPDIVLILGDTFDGKGSVDTFIADGYGDILAGLQAKYGAFAVTGNHEYYMPDTKEAISLLEKAGISVLLDDSAYISEINTYIIGRKDFTSVMDGRERMSLRQIMKRPQYHEPDSLFLVLDHNPKYIDESREVYADIQFSGHTHNGQLFPLNLIEKFIFEKSWGLSKKKYTTLFVSSGLGMWGPAVRTSAVSEIAKIVIVPSEKKQDEK